MSLGLSQSEPDRPKSQTQTQSMQLVEREVALENRPSGREWVKEFPTSRSVDDLAEPFRSNCTKFVQSLRASGAKVDIEATLRPPERAYLMHYAFRIANEGLDPVSVPPMKGVNIDWTHGGNKNAAVKAASEMVAAYNIAYRPALNSRHSEGNAIDMAITGYARRTFIDGNGEKVVVNNQAQLNALGESFGVKKLAKDPPHWSSDGR